MELKLRGIRKHYARAPRPVLDDIDLETQPGLVVTIGGESGAGKTTLWRIAAGLLEPDTGTVHLGDQQPWRQAAKHAAAFRRRHLGLLFQGGRLLDELTAEENVALPLLLDRRHNAHQLAREALARFGLADRGDDLPGNLSGGEVVRTALARAMVNRPALILADEPTASLDPEAAAIVIDALRGAAADGASVLAITHDRELTAVADRALRLDAGQLLSNAP